MLEDIWLKIEIDVIFEVILEVWKKVRVIFDVLGIELVLFVFI